MWELTKGDNVFFAQEHPGEYWNPIRKDGEYVIDPATGTFDFYVVKCPIRITPASYLSLEERYFLFEGRKEDPLDHEPLDGYKEWLNSKEADRLAAKYPRAEWTPGGSE